MESFSLAIEGAIGVGKTTLARLLQPRFNAELLLEKFEENPFLSDFYADRARYAFQTQIFFLLSRYRQQQRRSTLSARGPVIADYTFAKDNLFAHLNLAGDELDVYERLYHVLADNIPAFDLVVYLRAETDVLMSRIATRDRTYERNMDRAYIDHLRQAYERYFADYTQTPLLVIDTDDLNYVVEPGALTFVEGQVRTALGIGVHQKPLPRIGAVPTGTPRPPMDSATWTAGWTAVGEFLAANEAMGRVGAALAESAMEQSAGPGEKLSGAIQDAMTQLQRLAHSAGVAPQKPTTKIG